MDINCKWKLLDRYVIDSDLKIWRLPFKSHHRVYLSREINSHIHQGVEKYYLNGNRYTKNQINKMCTEYNKIIVVKTKKPF